jgi:hypothetical protein
MESEFYGAPPSILRLMGNRTAVVEVQYVDYMVARNFLNLVDEWFKGIPKATELKFLHWLQVRSHYIPRLARFFTVIFVGYLVVALIPHFIIQGSTDLQLFARYLGYAMIGTYSAYTFAGWSAAFIESALDNYTELSYLNLTKGDEIEIGKAKRNNIFAIAKGIGGFVLTICVSIFTKIVASMLTS